MRKANQVRNYNFESIETDVLVVGAIFAPNSFVKLISERYRIKEEERVGPRGQFQVLEAWASVWDVTRI